MKYTYLTRFSILAVGIIFLLQGLLVYRLYQVNVDLLQRELNLMTEFVYNTELNFRLGYKKESKTPDVQFGDAPPPGVDTTKAPRIDVRDRDKSKDKGLVSVMSLAMDEFVSQKYPMSLQRIDSLMQIALNEKNIKLKFYSEIIDLETDSILKTTRKDSSRLSNPMYSKEIPLNVKQTKALRIVLIDSKWQIYPDMAWMLVLGLLLSIFCIYSLYKQKKILARQRELATVKNEFFSEISHEFKRPLSTLLQTMESLKNETIVMNVVKRMRMLKIGIYEVLKMTGKTEMLLSLAQDEEGLFQLHCSEFDLVKVVFDLADSAIETTPGTPPEIDVDNELKNPMIFADQVHVEQMISNLISNAIKYSKDDCVDIHIRLYQENDNVCISVKDTGLGISPEHLQVIFDRYSRVGKPTHAKGHGIGLSYVKRISEKHGGSVSVESELNVGSEFIVKLPIIKSVN